MEPFSKSESVFLETYRSDSREFDSRLATRVYCGFGSVGILAKALDAGSAGPTSLFAAQLENLLAREQILPKLLSSIESLSSKSVMSLHDAVHCLTIGHLINQLINLPGGLSAILVIPKERFLFRKLCAGALRCRVPLVAMEVVQLLAQCSQLPAHLNGGSLCRTVLNELDAHAEWGVQVCSPLPLAPTKEANAALRPPKFAVPGRASAIFFFYARE